METTVLHNFYTPFLDDTQDNTWHLVDALSSRITIHEKLAKRQAIFVTLFFYNNVATREIFESLGLTGILLANTSEVILSGITEMELVSYLRENDLDLDFDSSQNIYYTSLDGERVNVLKFSTINSFAL